MFPFHDVIMISIDMYIVFALLPCLMTINCIELNWTWTWTCTTYCWLCFTVHYNDVIMSAMASQITGVSVVYSTVCLENIKAPRHWPFLGHSPVTGEFPIQRANNSEMFPFDDVIMNYCPACRTTLIATRFRVAMICPIIQVPQCIRVFFYFVWFVFINHIFQFYNELCTYCNILDIYLS